MVAINTQNTAPLMGANPESRIHDAAKGFVGTFFTQMMEQMFSEVNESSEDGFETEMYGSFMSEAMAEKIADSGVAKDMTRHVENKMRRNSGLKELKNPNVVAGNPETLKSEMIKIQQDAQRQDNNQARRAQHVFKPIA